MRVTSLFFPSVVKTYLFKMWSTVSGSNTGIGAITGPKMRLDRWLSYICWQSVFLSNFSRGCEARNFNLKGNGTRASLLLAQHTALKAGVHLSALLTSL